MKSIMQYIYTTGRGGVYGYSEQWQSLNQMVRMKAKSTMEDVKALKAGTLTYFAGQETNRFRDW